MTIKERSEFTARWLDVLNSEDAGSPKQRRIIIAALAKVHGVSAAYPNGGANV